MNALHTFCSKYVRVERQSPSELHDAPDSDAAAARRPTPIAAKDARVPERSIGAWS
jgi:hypothetical protein